MAKIYQEVHPYKPNVTKSCSKRSFSWAHFFTKLPESFCILSMKGSVPRISKNILKKVSQKVEICCLFLAMILDVKIIFFHFQDYTMSQKVEYLHNQWSDLYEI